MFRKVIGVLLFSCFILSSSLYCSSAIFMRITKNLQEKAEIALLLSSEQDSYWKEFISVLSRDFDYSGYFSVYESRFSSTPETDKSRYTTQLVLIAEYKNDKLAVRVEDMLDNNVLFHKEYGKHERAYKLAHKVCDDIVLHLTGKPGIAGSKILFVSDKTGKYQLYVSDYDGENSRQLTDAEYLVHYPRWMHPYDDMVFVSYQGGWPKLVRKNILTGSEKLILAKPGLNACASPNIKTGDMAVVLSSTGRPEIYVTDFDGGNIRRVTFGNSTDASPSFSPCGSMIAFVSDRHGTAQIYMMTRTGTRVRRISYVSGYSTSPAWSPDGMYIAYVFLRGGRFGIALYEVATGETKILGDSLGSEDISWAANSRHLVYSDMVSKPGAIVILDIVTGEKRILAGGKDYNAFSADWGVPFIDKND